jgi:hypothetical protein
MTKIYENDERDKLLPISTTTNFILRTSRAMFLIKRKVANAELDISIDESYIRH